MPAVIRFWICSERTGSTPRWIGCRGGERRKATMDFVFVVCWLVKGIGSKCRGFWWLVLTKKSVVQNQSLRHCEGLQPGHDRALEGKEEGHETGTKGARRERKAWAPKENEPGEILLRQTPHFCAYLVFQSWYSKIDFVSVCVYGCAGLWILALVWPHITTTKIRIQNNSITQKIPLRYSLALCYSFVLLTLSYKLNHIVHNL